MGAPISSIVLSQDSVFAAAGSFIGRYVRGKEIDRLLLPPTDSPSSSASSSAPSSSDSDSSDDEADDTPAETLSHLTLFGTTMLALGSSGTKMYVWDVPPFVNPASVDPNAPVEEKKEARTTPYATINFSKGFTATKVVHPASYLNKVVVGSREGAVAVWNVRTGYVFPCSSCSDRANICAQLPHPHL